MCLVHEFVCAWTRILHMCMQSSSLEMKKKRVQEQEKKKKKRETFTLIEQEMFVVQSEL